MAGHAKLSPSSAERWMTCPGSVALSEGYADSSSAAADEGTAAHELAERILLGAKGDALVGLIAQNGVEWTAEMLQDVLRYTQSVQALVGAVCGTLMVEQRLPISEWTGESGAHGTADAVILAGTELIVADLKFGRGVVVDADENKQLRIYALAALREFEFVGGPFEQVRIIISQPRLGAWSEWTCTVAELEAFGDEVKAAAAAVSAPDAPLVPSGKGCKWCRAAADCPALKAEVLDMFDNVKPDDILLDGDTLGDALGKVGLVETWCKAVRAEAERRLLAGVPVKGFKLVQGKQGNRRWADAAEAEAMLKAFRLKTEEMYDLSLITPTTAEKLLKPTIDPATGEALKPRLGPRQWKKAIGLITRSEGSPSVAPESDKRPALVLQAATDDFDAVATPPEQPPVETPLEASPESFV